MLKRYFFTRLVRCFEVKTSLRFLPGLSFVEVTKLLWKVVNRAMNQKSKSFPCKTWWSSYVFVKYLFSFFLRYLSKCMQLLLKTLWLQRWNMAKERKWTKGSINLANSEFTPSVTTYMMFFVNPILCFFIPRSVGGPPQKNLYLSENGE